MLEAVKLDNETLQYADKSLQNDPDLLKLVKKKN